MRVIFIALIAIAAAGCQDDSVREGTHAEASTSAAQPAASQPEQTIAQAPSVSSDEQQVAPVSRPGWKSALCAVESSGEEYRGPCDFLAERGGTFSVQMPGGNEAIAPGVANITVAVIAPGEAEVRGLTLDGINSRWGSAIRSQEDPACWLGSDFRVCAY
uniref:hypothetical protein n=1 Tax=Parerythrobacter lutipelagi TaxID=1964208 RepID=UPI0010F7F288|nr:hypothetical protein [Parerythrobacter lutipelagi]